MSVRNANVGPRKSGKGAGAASKMLERLMVYAPSRRPFGRSGMAPFPHRRDIRNQILGGSVSDMMEIHGSIRPQHGNNPRPIGCSWCDGCLGELVPFSICLSSHGQFVPPGFC